MNAAAPPAPNSARTSRRVRIRPIRRSSSSRSTSAGVVSGAVPGEIIGAYSNWSNAHNLVAATENRLREPRRDGPERGRPTGSSRSRLRRRPGRTRSTRNSGRSRSGTRPASRHRQATTTVRDRRPCRTSHTSGRRPSRSPRLRVPSSSTVALRRVHAHHARRSRSSRRHCSDATLRLSSGRSRFGTIAADVDPTRHAPTRGSNGAAGRRDPAAVRGVLRRARPHGRSQRQPRPGRRPDAAVHELGHGPVQGRADRGREARLHPRGRLPALPAGRRQAQRLRGGRADAAPPHALRDARQLELRRLLQARGDPLGLGLPDARPRRSRGSGWPRRPTRPTMSRSRSGATRSACPPERLVRWGDFPNGDEQNWWRMADIGPCGPCSRDPLRPRRAPARKGPECVPDHSETARAGSRSGTSCSWSSSCSRTAR